MFIKGRTIASGEGVTGWVLANRKPFCNTDPRLDLPPALFEQFDAYRTLAAFPIIRQASLYGAVTIYSSELHSYSAPQQKRLRESTGLLAAALARLSDEELQVNTACSAMGLADAVLDYELTH